MSYRSIKPGSSSARLPGLLVLVAVTLLVTGCLSTHAVVAIDIRPARKASFAIMDQRPLDERTTRWLSDVVFSCAFTVRQYADDAVSPDRFTVLTNSLNAGLHERLAGKVLVVTHFGIYINNAQRSRGAQFSRGEGLVQSLADHGMGRRFDRLCLAEQVAEGWLEAGHADPTHPVVIVQITLILEGRTHSVRIFADASSSGRATAMVSAIKLASDRLIADWVAGPSVITAATP